MSDARHLLACHECDLLHRTQALADGDTAKCSRCGAVLYQQKHNGLERTLMLNLAALVLFVLANVYPFMTFELEGRVQQNTLITGVLELYGNGMVMLAVLVFCASILAPAMKILGTLYVLLPVSFNRLPWKAASAFRWIQTLSPWAMMEVYMLGVLVAIVKLSQLATIVPGIALYSFVALIVITAAASVTLDPRIVWDRIEVAR